MLPHETSPMEQVPAAAYFKITNETASERTDRLGTGKEAAISIDSEGRSLFERKFKPEGRVWTRVPFWHSG